MKKAPPSLARSFLAAARHSLAEQHLPRVVQCLRRLSEEDIWWRPHETSNSVGNLVLHLSGNVRQWIISGLGGAPDRRERDKEFAERGPLPRRQLTKLLRSTVLEACQVISTLDADRLLEARRVQGFQVTTLEAVAHVAEHFAYHTGQIVCLTKLRLGVDLHFTRLAGDRRPGKRLSQL